MSLKDLAYMGDILLYRIMPSSNLTDKVIGKAEWLFDEGTGVYCHAAIVEPLLVLQLQATWPRVNAAPIKWSDPSIDLYRIKDATDAQLITMLRSAATHIGQWYGVGDIFDIRKVNQLDVCSQLVFTSAAAGDMMLAPSAEFIVSPDDLSKSPMLYKVNGNYTVGTSNV